MNKKYAWNNEKVDGICYDLWLGCNGGSKLARGDHAGRRSRSSAIRRPYSLGCCEAKCFGISRIKILWIMQGPMLPLSVVASTLKQECSSGGGRQSSRDSHVPKLYHTWKKKKKTSQVFPDCLQHTLSGWSSQAGWGNNDYSSKRQNSLGLKESGAIANSGEEMACGCLRF